MLRSCLLVAARSLRRHIGFTTLNILGLAAGLACVILIGLWVTDELSYDDFHPNAERTYRVLRTFDTPDLRATIAHGPAPLAPTLSDGYTQVEHAVRLDPRELTVETGTRRTVQDSILFAGLAILIACLSLFGLAAYSARRRTKEIGLRKALGATARSVITLVSADFLRLVGIAFLLAAPAAYLALERWLASYAYRIDIGPSIFAFAGVLAVLIAAATVSTQAWRAVRVDPTTALRSE
jgi:putative ABC transport system permease protein